MREQDYAAAMDRWREWIHGAIRDIGLLVLDDHLFRRQMEVAAQDKIVEPASEVYQWALRVFGTSTAIGIRRMLDDDDRTYSLRALLMRIEKNPNVVSRQEFVAGYPPELRSAAQRTFDRVGGTGDVLSAAKVAEDRARLDELARKIVPTVDKLIAHRERNPSSVPQILWDDLHDAIGILEEIALKYSLLLLLEGPTSLLPSMNVSNAEKDIKTTWGNRSW